MNQSLTSPGGRTVRNALAGSTRGTYSRLVLGVLTAAIWMALVGLTVHGQSSACGLACQQGLYECLAGQNDYSMELDCADAFDACIEKCLGG
jgi:hypothetical protein